MAKYLLHIILLAVLVSCSEDGRIIKKMDHIREVGDTNPTQAKVMLDSLEVEVRTMSKHIQSKYDLLSIRLDDKVDIIPSSDIKIKEILDYYIKNGNEREKQEAYYYAASVYRDMNDTPHAIEYFLVSCKIAEDNSGMDSIMLRNSYSNLAYIYTNVQDYAHALETAKKEYNIAKKTNAVTINAIMHLAGTYMVLDSTSQAKKKLCEALQIIKESHTQTRDRDFLDYILMNMSTLKMSQAHECFSILKEMGIDNSNCTERSALSSYYEFTNQHDYAVECSKYILDNSDNILNIYDATLCLFRLYQKKGDYITANVYAQKFIDINEKYNLGERQEIAATTNNRFQYHRNKEEEQRIKEEKDRYLFIAIISGISLLLFVTLLSTVYTYKRNRHLKRALALANEINGMRVENENLSEALQKKENELFITTQQLNTVKNNLRNVNEELDAYTHELKEKEQLLEGKIEQNKSLIRMLSLSETESAAEEIISRIRKASEGKYMMKPKDWRCLYHAIDELYPDFRDNITRNLGNFSEQEMQMCYLMRAGLENHHIQNIMPMSRATVWRWTKRMNWIPRTVPGYQKPDLPTTT